MTLAVFGRTINYPFEFDDITSVVENPSVKSLSNIPAFFIRPATKEANYQETGAYRPVVFASYALDYSLGGLKPAQFRLTNIVLHIINCILLFLLIQSLLAPRGPDPWPWSLIAAALFCVHPIQTEPVIYVAARSVLLLTSFFLASLICYVRYRTTGRVQMLVAAVALYSLSLLSKESAVPLAGVFVMLEFYLSRHSGQVPKGYSWRGVSSFFAASALFVPLRLYIMSLGKTPPEMGGYAAHWTAELAVLPRYLKLLVLPWGLSVDHYSPVGAGIYLLAGTVMLALAGYIAIRYFKQDPLIAALVAWPFLALLTEMLFPLPDKMVEYRLYLPLAGILVLKAAFVQDSKIIGSGTGGVAALVLSIFLVGALGTASYVRAGVWASPETLWSDAVEKAPLLARPRYNLGDYYYKHKDYRRASEYFREAVRLKPDFDDAYAALGNAYVAMGQPGEAVGMYKKAFELNKENIAAGNNLAVNYVMLGDYQAAFRTFVEMSDASPDNNEIVDSAAELFEYYGRQDLADGLYRHRDERIRSGIGSAGLPGH